jgi:hypothetical protein
MTDSAQKSGVDDEKKLAGYVLTQYALFQEGDIFRCHKAGPGVVWSGTGRKQ